MTTLPSLSPRLSRRALGLAESATMRVNRRAGELRAEGRRIVDLSAGQPDFPTPQVAVEAARRALADGHTGYTAAAGLPDLRRAVAARYAETWDAPWDAGQAVITVGAKAALFQAFQVLVDEGDEVVIPTPAWVSFEEQVRFAGGTPVAVETSMDDRFQIRAQPIFDALTERTRVVLINTPSNPTGGVATPEEMGRLVRGCADRGVIVLADETYERYVWTGEPASFAGFARDEPETVVVISSFSKTYSMTGWRLGWLLGPQEVVDKVIALQSHATSNPTTFAMYGALAALDGAQADVEAMIDEFGRRRTFVVDALDRLPGVRCQPPDGAFYAFADVSARFGDAGIDGSVSFCERLLEGGLGSAEEAGVALVPGIAFGDDRFVRLSFANARSELEAGVEAMERILASL